MVCRGDALRLHEISILVEMRGVTKLVLTANAFTSTSLSFELIAPVHLALCCVLDNSDDRVAFI